MSLFRKEALAAKQPRWLSDIVLIRPLSFTFLAGLAGLLALSIALFAFFGSYTKKTTVPGMLVLDNGLVKVFPTQVGTVTEKKVTEGTHVKAGQVLYVMTNLRKTGELGDVDALISHQVEQKKQSLEDEINKTKFAQQDENASLQNRITGLEMESAKIDSLLKNQRERLTLSKDILNRYQNLMEQDFISREQFQSRNEEYIDQKSRLDSLEREKIGVQRSISEAKRDLNGLQFKHSAQISQIERAVTSANQELVESQVRKGSLVFSPVAGIVTGLIYEPGQTIDQSRPMASIIPENSKLMAELYVPSRSIGFINLGDKVNLRYQAFPYQKFGYHRGIVNSISKTALNPSEISSSLQQAGGAQSEPLYRVRVKLNNQDVLAYGHKRPLTSGMTLEADMLQERRKIYEWVLEPLFTLTGKI